MSYSEVLKSPKWQRRRLEKMEADGWACKRCGDTEATLTVHHKSYRMVDGKFVDVWDYPDCDLITLCDPCHNLETQALEKLKKSLYYDIQSRFENADAIEDLLDFIDKLFYAKGGRLNGYDFFSLLFVDELDFTAQLKSYMESLDTENGDRRVSCVVDCCNFILIDGLGCDQ